MQRIKSILYLLIVSVCFFALGWWFGKRDALNVINTPSVEDIIDNRSSLGIQNQNGNVLLHWNDFDIQFKNVNSSMDNPWGFNAGIIDDNEYIFLTPNTNVHFFNVSKSMLNEGFELYFEIHPWVSESSDGAGIIVWYLAEDNSIVEKDEFLVDSSASWQKHVIKCTAENVVGVQILCNNGQNDNDDADWVIIKNSYNTSDFGKDDYVRSVTYYGDEWPINFWNSEFDYLDDDFTQIKNDGFNSIIIIIPWKEFQISTNPIVYNDYTFDKLDELMKKANEYGLDVYARVGYTWDFFSDSSEYILERQLDILRKEEVHEAWLNYCKTLFEKLSKYENFKNGFLTWEDFWGCLAICDIVDEDERVKFASEIGYQEWLQTNYELNELKTNYGFDCESFTEIPVPFRAKDADMQIFYQFYDEYLMKLLKETQDVFTNMSLEVRLDWDVYKDKNGEQKYYDHNATFKCENSDYTATMYGIPMGCENVGEKISYEEALGHTEYILSGLMEKNGGKPVYVEQFLYMDNTPQFSYNAQIKEEEVGSYLETVSGILLKYSKGYGVWTYRDYRNNMLYNAQFALSDKGWTVSGTPIFKKYDNSMTCEMKTGDSLLQVIPSIRDHFHRDKYEFTFDVLDFEDGTVIQLAFGNQKKQIEIKSTGRQNVVFDNNGAFDLCICIEQGKALIDNLCLYSFVQEGFLYDTDDKEQKLTSSIRILNRELDIAY